MAKGVKKKPSLFAENPDKHIEDVVELMPQRIRGESLMDIPLANIEPDPEQPRKEFTEEDLDGLHARIQATGGKISKPIDVKPHPSKANHYLLEDGEMRWRVYSTRTEHDTIAARVMVTERDKPEVLLRQLMANIGSIDMSLMNVAQGIQEWCDLFTPPKTRKEAAAAFGWNTTRMSRTLNLLNAPAIIQAWSDEITNINVLDSMRRVYELDKPAFNGALEEFQSDQFNENPEKFWRRTIKELTEPAPEDPQTDTTTGQLQEDRQQSGAGQHDPAASESREANTATDTTPDEGRKDTPGTSESAKDQSSQRGTKTSAAALNINGASVTRSSNPASIAVLQLSYSMSGIAMTSDYAVQDKAVLTALRDQLNELLQEI